MFYTISNFLNHFSTDVSLIAGRGGMSRKIKEVAILDYELCDKLKNRYSHTTFCEDQLILTSFLYAKDNPFLIDEAVKYLVAKGTSGLAIRNVFNLPIGEQTLRYADSKHFPIMLIKSTHVYFEHIVYEVDRHAGQMADVEFARRELDTIFAGSMSEADLRYHAKQLNPSIQERYFCVYFKYQDDFNQDEFLGKHLKFESSDFNIASNCLCQYKQDGVLFICSGDVPEKVDNVLAEKIISALSNKSREHAAGFSDVHFTLADFKYCVMESVYAALLNEESNEPFSRYRDAGVYKVLFPAMDNNRTISFSKSILEPISDYDIANHANLLETLKIYLKNDCDLQATADELQQHINTIRYRLEKLRHLINLNYKSFSQMEQISLAIKISQCESLLSAL